jgi:hypothetical protein
VECLEEQADLRGGEFIDVRITGALDYDLIGETTDA